MNTNKSLDELKAEAEAAAKALAEAERAAREKSAEQKAAEERAKTLRAAAERNEKLMKHCAALVEALTAVGVKASVQPVTNPDHATALPQVKVGDGGFGPWGVSLEKNLRHSGSGFRARYVSSGFKFIVGNYGERVSYPQKADGTFNYAKIAAKVKERVDVVIAQADAKRAEEAKRAANAGMMEELQAEFPDFKHHIKTVSGYRTGGHHWVEHSAPVGKVYVEVGTLTLGKEDAQKVLTLIAELRAAAKASS